MPFDKEKLRQPKSPTADALDILIPVYKDDGNETKDFSGDKNTSVSENRSNNESNNGSENSSENKSGLETIDINKIASKRPKKPKFEELHTKDNVWLRNDVKEILDSLTKGNKGEKVRIVNDALIMFFKSQSE